MAMQLPTLEEVAEAQKLVYKLMLPTPQISWPLLNQKFEASLWIKHENHTPIGAFKARSAVFYAAQLFRSSNDIKGIITATRGNHGQSVALAGQRFRVPVTIVVPHGNSVEKNAAMRSQGARLIEFGNDFQESREYAQAVSGTKPALHPADFIATSSPGSRLTGWSCSLPFLISTPSMFRLEWDRVFAPDAPYAMA